jgi:hypothetical protein
MNLDRIVIAILLVASPAVLLGACGAGIQKNFESSAVMNDRPILSPPKAYDVPFAMQAPTLDGLLDDGAWANASWSEHYGDIQGPELSEPRFKTRMKMLWDDSYLYVGVEMQEPDLWATYEERDLIVYHEHDFEIFIDPDGDAREYYEIEVNVLGTIFDLYLYNAYRDGGPAEHGWDCAGLVSAINHVGTINDPSDRDTGWTLEWAIPFSSLVPPPAIDGDEGPERSRLGRAPLPWTHWRINFSRVQWHLDVANGAYVKRPDTPEDNWTWTPQWEINMHVPQHWGFVRFLPSSVVGTN